MSIVGAPNNWADLIESLVPEILRLVVTTWEEIPSPGLDDREDDISRALCLALKQNRDLRKLMFQIQFQYVELEPEAGQDLGRLDIAFVPLVPREDIYFCLECKRLNVIKDGAKRAYTSEYVAFGVVRFVTGQYAKAVHHGGMLGYVLDGDVTSAIKNIEINLQNHHSVLGMDPPGKFEQSSVLVGDARARETRHHRKHDTAFFCIHHLFV
jgi:hypothetical protein